MNNENGLVLSDIVIEVGIPIPKKKNIYPQYRAAWNAMMIGNSIVISKKALEGISSSVYKNGGKFSRHALSDEMVRIWKIKNTDRPL